MGMTATLHVHRLEPRPVALLPLTAVTQSGQQPIVWLYDATTHTVNPQPVTLGSYEADSARILGGVKTGDQVVVAGVHKLLPGEKVRLLEEAQP